MVELRKRKAAPEAPAPPLKKSNSTKAASTKPKLPDAKVPSNGKNSSGITVGQQISLDSFGGEVETNEGEKTSLKKLVGSSSRGVVLFTYPKASTPGCTTQACLFRDDFTSLTSTGYSIYGLSRDSPKSNTTFQTKHSLPYSLLCDPAATLITAIGMKKAPSGTTRGVFVISKEGIVQATAAGGPAATVDIVRNLIAKQSDDGEVETADGGMQNAESSVQHGSSADDGTRADVAAEVADTAEKLDKES